jgi:hypothetical protein
MADLRPIGSEKLEGSDKLRRIMEIANYGNPNSNINESSSSASEYSIQLADGNYYGIVREKSGYIVKRGINESQLDYIDPMKNRKYHSSYSQAMRKINLIAGELNRLHENEEGVNLIGEQKKFVLKTPKPAEPEVDMSASMDVEAPAPAPAPAPEGGEEMDVSMDAAPAPEGGEEMDMSMDMDAPEGGEEMDMSMDMDAPEGGDDDEEMSFKTIQKLTGKLGQKLRTFDSSQGMSSENIKYVLNSILSALDLSKLTEEDYDDVMSKFEEDEDEVDYGVEDETDIDIEAGDDLDFGDDMEMDAEVDAEVGEMTEDHDEDYDDMFLSAYADNDEERTWYNRGDRPYKGGFSDIEFDEIPVSSLKDLLGAINGKKQKWFATKDSDAREFGITGDGEEMFKKYSQEGPLTLRVKRPVNASYDSALDEIFSESKIEKVLSKYFVVTEAEEKMNKDKKVKNYITERVKNSLIRKEIKNLCETVEQELTTDFIIKEHNNVKFIGKTNKQNLVFEADGKTIKVSSKGEIL